MITRRTFAGLSVSIAIALASAVPALAETTFEKIKRTGTMVVGTEAAIHRSNSSRTGRSPASAATCWTRSPGPGASRSSNSTCRSRHPAGASGAEIRLRGDLGRHQPERAARYAYTLPIADSTAYAIKRAGNDHIKGVEDLAGKVVATQLASAVDPVAKALDEKLKAEGKGFSELKLFPTFNDSFLAVANGTADAAMAGLPVLQNLMNERPGVFELVGQAADTQSLNAWVVRPEDKDLRDAINAVVLELKASGRFAELQQKWLGMTYDLPEKDYLPEGAL